MSRLIDELSDTIFSPRHFGVTFPSVQSDYKYVPGVKSSVSKFIMHYSLSYQRFCNLFSDDGVNMSVYSDLSQMEARMKDRHNRLEDLIREEESLFRRSKILFNEVEKADSLSDISGGEWTTHEVETQKDLPKAESPTVALVNSFDWTEEGKDSAIFVHFGSNTKYYRGPHPEGIKSLSQATAQFMHDRLENKARFEQKSAIVQITHDALEDVLFEYEVSGSVGHQEEFGPEIDSPSDDETSGPGAKPIKDDHELREFIEDAAEESEEDFGEMSNRALAKLLVEEFDAPYTIGTLRKRISGLSGD